jgi:RNase H-fold protein (predicted Holliday junction resolvase)
MTRASVRSHRVLAIDPTNRGFGFAVLEGPTRLVDWGVKRVKGTNVNGACLAAVVRMMRWYEPDVLVLEDCGTRGARRRQRTSALIEDLAELAERRQMRCSRVPWTTVREPCGNRPGATKEQIAAALATRFPELARHLPPHRKPWMSEDVRMSVFDAVALAVAWFHAHLTRGTYGVDRTASVSHHQ